MRLVLELAVSKGNVDFIKYLVTEQSVDVNGESWSWSVYCKQSVLSIIWFTVTDPRSII